MFHVDDENDDMMGTDLMDAADPDAEGLDSDGENLGMDLGGDDDDM